MLKLNTKCCNKEMYKENFYVNGTDITAYVCLKCGNHLSIQREELDEEVLEGYKERAKTLKGDDKKMIDVEDFTDLGLENELIKIIREMVNRKLVHNESDLKRYLERI